MIPAIPFASILAKIGIRGGIIIALCLTLAFVMWRADGLSEKLDRSREQVASLIAASQAAQKLAEQQKAQTEAKYRADAERASNDHEIAVQNVLSAANAYAARNRVCKAGGDSTGATPAAAQDHGAGFPAGMPSDSFVAISDADLQACSAATAYAVSAHDFVADLVR